MIFFLSGVLLLNSWAHLLENTAADLLPIHLGLLRFDLQYLQEREIPPMILMDMIFCREMMEKEEDKLTFDHK